MKQKSWEKHNLVVIDSEEEINFKSTQLWIVMFKFKTVPQTPRMHVFVQ
jgi:hypothetical protein